MSRRTPNCRWSLRRLPAAILHERWKIGGRRAGPRVPARSVTALSIPELFFVIVAITGHQARPVVAYCLSAVRRLSKHITEFVGQTAHRWATSTVGALCSWPAALS